MTKPIMNVEGEKYGMLTVVKEVNPIIKNGQKYRMVKCICDCGKEITRSYYSVRHGKIQSCGCLNRGAKKTHGESGFTSYYYRTWCSIKRRCYNPNYWQYRDWGGRGITMCDEWLHNYIAFRTYIFNTIGERPNTNYTLDRIDNNKNYETGNIKWSTMREQCNNRRNRSQCKLDGDKVREIRLLKDNMRGEDVAKKYNVSRSQIYLVWQNKVWKHIN